MTRLLDPTTDPSWRSNFGRRYLRSRDFTNLCKAVGLGSCREDELEQYEREGWLFPAARLVTPEAYARAYREAELGGLTKFEIDEDLTPFHELDRGIRFYIDWPDPRHHDDLRHPIDKAWGRVPQLVRPCDEDFWPWDSYRVEFQIDDMVEMRNLEEHLYHYWQIYELYQVRRSEKGMYRQDFPLPGLWVVNRSRGDYSGLGRGLDAVSQFQHLHERQRRRYLAPLTPDEDREILLTDSQQTELEELIRGHARAVCQALTIEDEELYHFLKGLMGLHHSYERSERVKLAKTLEYDIWRTIELIEALTGSPTQQIAERAGRAGPFREPYLEVLFPNRREQARQKSLRILNGVADEEYNQRASSYAIEARDLEALLDFAESTDLGLFGYILVEVNEAFFARQSWRIAASYSALKSPASLPESLTRTVIEQSADRRIIAEPHPSATKDLYNGLCFLLSSRERAIWRAYEDPGLGPYRSAANKAEFSNSLAHLATLIKNSENAQQYLSRSATLATLLRNFTSHHLLEDRQLLQGQYVRSVRAIVATVLLIWKTAQKHSLLVSGQML